MKTIGKFLRDARDKKRYSLKKVENATKIKRQFIEAIEKENWRILPDFAVIAGFIKNLSHFLGISEKTAMALLRRDYPPRSFTVSPKPDVGQKFVWSPKLSFIAGVGAIVLIVLFYLGFQYVKFITPPKLEVYKPQEGEVVNSRMVTVSGKTDGSAAVAANNQPLISDDEGAFASQIQIYEGTTQITVKAISRSGKETSVARNIKVQIQ